MLVNLREAWSTFARYKRILSLLDIGCATQGVFLKFWDQIQVYQKFLTEQYLNQKPLQDSKINQGSLR
jgi:hypothetical protein